MVFTELTQVLWASSANSTCMKHESKLVGWGWWPPRGDGALIKYLWTCFFFSTSLRNDDMRVVLGRRNMTWQASASVGRSQKEELGANNVWGPGSYSAAAAWFSLLWRVFNDSMWAIVKLISLISTNIQALFIIIIIWHLNVKDHDATSCCRKPIETIITSHLDNNQCHARVWLRVH